MRSQKWSTALKAAMQAENMTHQELSDSLANYGHTVTVSQIRSWTSRGTIPRQGLQLVPVLARVLNIRARNLIP